MKRLAQWLDALVYGSDLQRARIVALARECDGWASRSAHLEESLNASRAGRLAEARHAARLKARLAELERAIPIVTDGRFDADSALAHLAMIDEGW